MMKTAIVASSFIGIVALVTARAHAAPLSPHLPVEMAAAFKTNHDGVKYYHLYSVVDEHDDMKKQFPTGTSITEMYEECLTYCKEQQCRTFDIVLSEWACYLDLTSNGQVTHLPEGAVSSEIAHEKANRDAIYVVMNPYYPAAGDSDAAAVQQDACYGMGYQWLTESEFIAERQPSREAALDLLGAQCGVADTTCKKWVTCDLANTCGALAVLLDATHTGHEVTPAVAFGGDSAAAQAKALAMCEQRLDAEGSAGECAVVATFCRS